MQRPISHLSVHDAVSLAWEMPDSDPRFASLVESVREHGLIEPLKVTADGKVVDGRHRLRAARAAGLESVECQVVPDHSVGEIAMATLCERRHLVTRGQLAYAAYPLFSRAHKELRERKATAMRSGVHQPEEETVEGYAARVGVSRDTFLQAARLHELFDADPELKREWEPKVMASEEPIGLGACIAGIRGQETSVGRTPQRNSALHNWEVAWRNITRPAGRWNRWTEEEREYATGVLREQFSKLPEPVLDAVRDALRATRRQRATADAPEGRLERMGLLSRRNRHADEAAGDDYQDDPQDAPSQSGLSPEARERIEAAAHARWARYPSAGTEHDPEVPHVREDDHTEASGVPAPDGAAPSL